MCFSLYIFTNTCASWIPESCHPRPFLYRHTLKPSMGKDFGRLSWFRCDAWTELGTSWDPQKRVLWNGVTPNITVLQAPHKLLASSECQSRLSTFSIQLGRGLSDLGGWPGQRVSCKISLWTVRTFRSEHKLIWCTRRLAEINGRLQSQKWLPRPNIQPQIASIAFIAFMFFA